MEDEIIDRCNWVRKFPMTKWSQEEEMEGSILTLPYRVWCVLKVWLELSQWFWPSLPTPTTAAGAAPGPWCTQQTWPQALPSTTWVFLLSSCLEWRTIRCGSGWQQRLSQEFGSSSPQTQFGMKPYQKVSQDN